MLPFLLQLPCLSCLYTFILLYSRSVSVQISTYLMGVLGSIHCYHSYQFCHRHIFLSLFSTWRPQDRSGTGRVFSTLGLCTRTVLLLTTFLNRHLGCIHTTPKSTYNSRSLESCQGDGREIQYATFTLKRLFSKSATPVESHVLAFRVLPLEI